MTDTASNSEVWYPLKDFGMYVHNIVIDDPRPVDMDALSWSATEILLRKTKLIKAWA